MKLWLNKISITDLLNIILLLILFVFYVFAVSNSPYKWQPLVVFAIAFSLVIWSIKIRNKKKRSYIVNVILAFYPLLFLFIAFESFFMILPWFNSHDYDYELAAIDLKILGVNPTVWIEHFIKPWLTDIMYIIYIFYFPLPWFLLIWLAKKRKYSELDKSVFILLLTYYIGYIGYFIFPAMGPRFYEPIIHLQQKQLNGIIFAQPIRNLIMIFEPNKFDAFPSLHAAVSLSTLLLMKKYNKMQFYIFLPIVIGIYIAVIYCRYHYFIDIIAGVIVSLIAYLGGKKIHTLAFKKYFIPYYKLNDV